jgi:hypothetical protein
MFDGHQDIVAREFKKLVSIKEMNVAFKENKVVFCNVHFLTLILVNPYFTNSKYFTKGTSTAKYTTPTPWIGLSEIL